MFAVVLMLTVPALMMVPDESEATPLDHSDEFYYNQLSEREQGLYRQIYSAARDFRESFTTGYTGEELKGNVGLDVLAAVRYDHPELIQLTNSYKYDTSGTMFLNYSCTRAELKDYATAITAFCSDLGSVVDDTDRSTIVTSLNEVIVKQTVYTSGAKNAHNIAGVFVDGQAVCEGYALSFKFLCDLYDVPCICVVGDGIDGDRPPEGHMWNYVMIGSDWYAMDVTWNDPTPDGGSSGPVSTDYSMVGSDTVIGTQKFCESHVTDSISEAAMLPEIELTEYTGPYGTDSSFIFPFESRYYYDKLTSDEKKAYDAIVAGLNNFDTTIYTGVEDITALQDAIRAIRYDRQDLFQLPNDGSSCTVWSDGKVEITYPITKSEYDSMVKDILTSLVDLEGSLSTCTTEYDKVLTIHDYLVSHIEYTKDAKNAHNIYGALVNGKCVCEGYARSFQYICALYGIEAICVSGDGTNSSGSEAHMWNMVVMNDGKWYYMDVTWDDPLVNGSDSGKVYYDYFLVGSETVCGNDMAFSVSHKADMVPSGPTYVFDNDMLPEGSPTEYYIRPNSDPQIEVEVTIGGTATACTAKAELTALETVEDYLQGHGSAVISFGEGNGKVTLTYADLAMLISYMQNATMDSITFTHNITTDKIALGPIELENDLHTFGLSNGTDSIALKDIGEKFEMTVYIPYEPSWAEPLNILIFAWDSETPYLPLTDSKYQDGFVHLTIDSSDSAYFVGSTPIKDVPVLYIIIGILVVLLVFYILLKHHARKKAKKRAERRKSKSSR